MKKKPRVYRRNRIVSIMKYMQPVRKMIGKVPTILNLVGPLINPYHLTYQMVGIFDPTKLKTSCKDN